MSGFYPTNNQTGTEMRADNMRGFSRLLAYINKFKEEELMLVKEFKMNHEKSKQVEAVLREYPYFNLLEKERRTEIEQERAENDENIGGSRGSFGENHAHENKTIRFSDDEIISTIKHNRDVIKKTISQLDDYQKTIVQLSYFQRFNRYNAIKIGESVNVSRATVFRFRKRLLAHLYPLLIL